MYQIRKCTFETNSSSVHNITICDKDMYEKWVNGEDMYIMIYNDRICTKDEAINYLVSISSHTYEEFINDEDLLNDYFEDCNICTYNEWQDREYETDITEYTTKSGDEIVVICEYGSDY